MWDVFISFKKTDENGKDTKDFAIATELYDRLTSMGYAVFFSSKTLETIGSSRYKADIDAALDEATVMVVVLTDSRHASSQWVQYEWDSFYNDFLTGVKPGAKLFTVVNGVNVHDLPRTLRNVQSFECSTGWNAICNYIVPAIPRKPQKQTIEVSNENASTATSKFQTVTGSQITYQDIDEAVALDRLVYAKDYWIEPEVCHEWHDANPDIYVMMRDTDTGRIIAYINLSPVTEECYADIRSGKFIDTGITADMILSYNMPFPHCLYFSSVVIHPKYQNTEVFMKMFNAIVQKFITLGEREVFMKKMIADAVSPEGEKFCKMFGMKKVDETDHHSTLYEVTLIPPCFRVSSKMTKKLHDFYAAKYAEEPFLFDQGES